MLRRNKEKSARPTLLLAAAAVAVLPVALWAVFGQTNRVEESRTMTTEGAAATGDREKATFGGGCFWCTEAIFEQLKGVHSVVSGYSGGHVENPSYEAVCTGTTGHAEVIQITYDPQVISYKELLEVFWKTHDPTTPNRQGNDVGPQYRSVIFFHDDEQRRLAKHYKKKLDASGAFDAPIVTEIDPFGKFYPAEDYHQEYYERNARQRYCSIVIRPKLEKFKKAFQDKLKGATDTKKKKVTKNNAEWRAALTDQQYQVTREKGTERAFSGEYWNHKEDGKYRCVCCGLPLFDSKTKYDSGCGWPSFWAPVDEGHVSEAADHSLFMERTEIKCSRCDAHLGHVFDDGPAPTGLRYCVNSAALRFEEAER